MGRFRDDMGDGGGGYFGDEGEVVGFESGGFSWSSVGGRGWW